MRMLRRPTELARFQTKRRLYVDAIGRSSPVVDDWNRQQIKEKKIRHSDDGCGGRPKGSVHHGHCRGPKEGMKIDAGMRENFYPERDEGDADLVISIKMRDRGNLGPKRDRG